MVICNLKWSALFCSFLTTTLMISAEEAQQSPKLKTVSQKSLSCYNDEPYKIYVFGDLLYGYSSESDMSYAMKAELQEGGSVVLEGVTATEIMLPNRVKEMKASWDVGFRLGMGFAVANSWDMFVDWTRFHNHTSSHISIDDFYTIQTTALPAGTSLLISEWVNPVLSIYVAPRPPIWDYVHASWQMHLNVINTIIQKKLCFSPSFSLDPFFGVRLAETNTQTRYLTSAHVINSLEEATFTDKILFKSRFYGAGLLVGLEPAYHIGGGLTLFGNTDVALMWGRYSTRRHEKAILDLVSTSTPNIPTSNLKLNFYDMQPVMDLAAGIRYETQLYKNRWTLLLQASWENHLWFDNVAKIQLTDRIDDSFSQLDGNYYVFFGSYDKIFTNLSVSGFVFRAGLDY